MQYQIDLTRHREPQRGTWYRDPERDKVRNGYRYWNQNERVIGTRISERRGTRKVREIWGSGRDEKTT